jgi:hypothetical protein
VTSGACLRSVEDCTAKTRLRKLRDHTMTNGVRGGTDRIGGVPQKQIPEEANGAHTCGPRADGLQDVRIVGICAQKHVSATHIQRPPDDMSRLEMSFGIECVPQNRPKDVNSAHTRGPRTQG